MSTDPKPFTTKGIPNFLGIYRTHRYPYGKLQEHIHRMEGNNAIQKHEVIKQFFR